LALKGGKGEEGGSMGNKGRSIANTYVVASLPLEREGNMTGGESGPCSLIGKRQTD